MQNAMVGSAVKKRKEEGEFQEVFALFFDDAAGLAHT